MCKCCQSCLETCYWNLIEEKFCFDESIATYEEPVKKSNEKNNNMFDNMAFYDSVSVIAGRAIVTIDPLPERKKDPEPQIVVDQPRRLKWPKQNSKNLGSDYINGAVPFISEPVSDSKTVSETDGTESETHEKLLSDKKSKLNEKFPIKKSVSFHNIPDKTSSSSSDEGEPKSKSVNLIVPEEEEVTLRKKSLRERRMSKSLSLKIDFPKELPIIRQNSVPKFYLDTPDENQTKESTLVRNSASVLKSPMMVSSDFKFDLYSVVQMEKDRVFTEKVRTPPVPIHRESSKLNLIKEKMKLKKSKSTVSAVTLPYSNHI
ncbi:uncharacterized protein LOC115884074 [Sitophilus oryzae]|uniref:Uncharacterized protein LOC115884074 n=1 Tax=Sitophilus oryzae TaxID=7048 RepID=A0A6J2Y3K3_SITOR|nr:uncharacterized protein LOC115884074 [Sitophilus oryzae]XP_030758394.1 uncharacterized protein LOC115884074 [Sitophilus oryzae]XP_030758395.1 uncharacterized protein LOC115884074 [Sitophilus oryzae]XP_030758396.1 uncharacterized protein LOC115884074 [Sitophilus oryzae]